MKVDVCEIKVYHVEKIRALLEEVFNKYNLREKLANTESVLIKPNLLGAFPPERSVTTHPAVIEAVIQILQNYQKKILVGDSPGGVVSVEKVWLETGLKQLSEKYDIQLVKFAGKTYEFPFQNTTLIIDGNVFESTAIINICKLKTHGMMMFTGAVKNLYGVVPGLKKADYHREFPSPEHFSDILTRIYEILNHKIVLNIMDGIWGMEGEGPSAGKARNFGLLLTSEKASALDAVASHYLGFKNGEIKHIEKALLIDNLSRDLIETNNHLADQPLKDADIDVVRNSNLVLNKLPEFMKKIFRLLFQFKPGFNKKCQLCGICVKSCPVKVMKIVANKKHPVVDYSKCIRCLCCHELCPYQAVFVKKSLLARFFLRTR